MMFETKKMISSSKLISSPFFSYASAARRKITPAFEEIRKAYEEFYKDEYFVRLLPDGMNADIHNIKYSNFCDISLHHDKRANKLVACSAIDNMVKGAAGQAIQNMNIIFGLDEKTGLEIVPPAF